MTARLADARRRRLCRAAPAAVAALLPSPLLAAVAPKVLVAVAEWTVHTAYVDLVAQEYRFPLALPGKGGAITVVEGALIVATADGRFMRVDLVDMRYRIRVLPDLKLGAAQVRASTRIKLHELPPRVHDLLFHRGRYYVAYDSYDADGDSIHFVIASMSPYDGRWKEIYRSAALDAPYFAMGSGGKMAVSAAGDRLYFTVGDYSLDRINHLPSDVAPQNVGLPWGKVNFLDLAHDNRFQVYSIGHRNPQGLLLLDDGRLIASEHGPRGGDELNVIREGRNYGWPHRSHGTAYDTLDEHGTALPRPATRAFEEPLFAFVPAVAPTQLVQAAGFHPKWDGNVLMGSLRAMSLFHIKLGADRVVFVEPIPIGHRIRDLRQAADRWVLLTDDSRLVVLHRK